MSVLSPTEDAFGQQLLDHHRGRPPRAVRLERDDGWGGPGVPAEEYFTRYDEWDHIERELLAHAHGRVLDLGAGAGRHALHLQDRGHDVVAVDHSPGAVRVCRERGLRQVELCDLTDLPDRASFDTVLLLSQNLGLAGDVVRTRSLLVDLHGRTRPGAVVLADTVDPLLTTTSPHREYHESSERRGRDVGQVRMRMRYGALAAPWFDLLMLPRNQLDAVVDGTGWQVEGVIGAGAHYGVVLRRG